MSTIDTESKKTIIHLNKLYKTYHTDGISTRALQGISFDIYRGEFVSIMGSSGSGKSTLLHILGFLDRATKGTYHFDGKSFDDYSGDEIALIRNKKMGFVFQAFNLLPRTTVDENIRLPLLYSDVPPAEWKYRIEKAIDDVGLTHRRNYESSQLSGGEKQRVAIARALIMNPDVIFADEPTGNLDSKTGRIIMEILQDLHEKQKHTIILITHETYTAEHAQRIITLKDGKLFSDRKTERQRNAYRDFIK